MTVVNPKSISGITSITTASGSDNLLTIHTSDANNTERFRIDSTGSAKVGSGVTLSPDGDIFTTGISTFGGNIQITSATPEIELNAGGPRFRVPASNTLSIHSGAGLGSADEERVRFTAGKVGINTNNPSELIDVLKTGNDAIIKTRTDGAGAYFEADSAATEGYYGLILSSSGTDRWFAGSYNSDNFQIKNGSGVSGTEVVTINDSTNYFGINHTTPAGVLHISSGTSGDCELIIEADTDNNNENDNPRILFRQDGGSDWNAIGTNDNVLEISNSVSLGGGISIKTGTTDGYTNATERLRITSSGQILTGHDTKSTNFHDPQTTTDRTPNIQIHGGNSVAASAALVSWNSNSGSYYSNALYLAHSGSSTIGTNSIVSGSNTLGSIVFSGDDGDEFIKGAMISAHVDGTPGANDMPARIQFWTNGGSDALSERARITNDGYFLLATTSQKNLGQGNTDTGVGLNPLGRLNSSRDGAASILLNRNNSNGPIQVFYLNGVQEGYININTSGVSFVAASDYRLKENETIISDGITRVKQLIPRRFNFKKDSTTVDGFFAHEVSPVVPESVFGEKDATINEEGDGYQMLDQSKLIPVLTASIKELIAKVETLEAEVAALKSN